MQRPGLDEQVRDELRALLLLVCEVLERIPQTSVGSPRALAEDFARTLHEEMDFRLEADNMEPDAADPRRASRSPTPACRDVHYDLVGRAGAHDGAYRGVPASTDVEGMQAARHRHRAAAAHGRADGGRGRPRARLLPRRPPRREHRGARRRHVRALRLRHRRPAHGVGPARARRVPASPSTTNDYASMVRALRSSARCRPGRERGGDGSARSRRLYEPFVTGGRGRRRSSAS